MMVVILVEAMKSGLRGRVSLMTVIRPLHGIPVSGIPYSGLLTVIMETLGTV